MMNNRVTRIIANTVGLAAVAALGITVYQLGTSPIKEEAPKEQTENAADNTEEENKANDDQSMVDAGTDQVESENQPMLEDDESLGDVELTSGNGSTDGTENLDGDTNADSVDNGEAEGFADVDKGSKTSSIDGAGADLLQNGENVSDDAASETTDVSASALNLPTVNFSEDTLMEWPVNGNILLDYSMDQTTYFPTLDQYKLSPAIAVGAVEGTPVVAAVNGTVYSIEQDVQTGTTVTMELGNGYQAIYGQLTDLNVAEGDTVKKGTTIGYIAQPTKYYSTEGTNLYFEMKKDGEPIDPIAYLP